jgi:hypothetical protein
MGLFEDTVKAVTDEGQKAVGAIGDTAEKGKDAIVNATGEVVKEVTQKGREATDQVSSETRKVISVVAAEGRAALDKIAAEGRKALDMIADEARKTRGTLSGAVDGFEDPKAPYQERLLTKAERNLAHKVFEDTLPYGAIYLSTGLGFGKRPYTIPHPLHLGSYVIHIGPKIFPDATDSSVVIFNQTGDAVFIHELTHVWQGSHRKNPFDYMVDSVYNQIRYGNKAYDLDDKDVGTKKWGEFNAEQQGMIVENWYANGRSETDKAFTYIRDNIRTGNA